MTRKIFAFIIGLTSFILFLLFFVGLNLQLVLKDPAKISSYIEESGASDLVVGYIKDNLVSNNKVSLSDGTNLEQIDSSINNEAIKSFVTETVTQFGKALQDPKVENLNFNLTFQAASPVFATQPVLVKTVSLSNNTTFLLLSKILRSMIFLPVVGFVLLLFALLILKNSQERLSFLGNFLILQSIAIILVYLGLIYAAPIYIKEGFSYAKFARDPRLLNSAKKIFVAVNTNQWLFYLAEVLPLFISGCVLAYLGKMFRKTNLGKIEFKI